eukprot:g4614.t1
MSQRNCLYYLHAHRRTIYSVVLAEAFSTAFHCSENNVGNQRAKYELIPGLGDSGSAGNQATDFIESVSAQIEGQAADIISSIARDNFVPFNVLGGDSTANIEEPTQQVEVNPNPNRPPGSWEFIVEAKVALSTSEVWSRMRNFGHILLYGLQNLADDFRSLDSKGKRWIIDVRPGENFVIEVTTTNDETFFHVVKAESHTSDVFPGVDISGSSFFIQFIPTNDGFTKIEFGWGGSVRGPRDVAKTAVAGFGQELVDNLEDELGETCESGKNIRTIEGDCNNLSRPKSGAAGHALIRLGNGDPAYPNGDPHQPSGPIHISPRVISNRLCAHSPGLGILEDKASSLRHECFTDTVDELKWEICPTKSASATFGRTTVVSLDWKRFKKHSSGSLMLHFSDGSCELEIMFICSGPKRLELFGEVCGEKGNRLYHPEACSIKSGEDQVLNSQLGLTDLFWSFGQFVDHDLDLTPVAQLADNEQPGFSRNSRPSDTEVMPIPVPDNDFYMQSTEMEFERSVLFKDRKRGLHENQHSAFADLGQLYGVDYLRARALRSFIGGKLKVSAGDLPPFNKIDGPGALRAKVDNAPDAEDKFFAVGDLRGNEQPTLLALHIIWIREHNLVCDELAAQFPKWTDDRLYQTARAIVIAEYQSILYDEWLPLLLGGPLLPSSGYSYNAAIDPSISAVFSTAAFRIGHTMVGSYLLKISPGDRTRATVEQVPLRDLFFKPEVFEREGIDDYVRGAAWHVAKEVDAFVVDELRNFLFTEHSNRGHMDLVALNLQRGRDMGLPSFNQCRRIFNLSPYTSFDAFIPDEHLAASSATVYENNVENVDLFYGCIAEKHHGNALVGQTAFGIIFDQFRRIRDGDRFFFKALQWDPIILSAYPRINDIMEGKIKLREIILRTTGISPRELGHRSSVFKV